MSIYRMDMQISFPLLLSVALFWIGLDNYLLFHTLSELFTVIIALLMGVVAWQTYPFSKNHFLMFLGCGYIWVGGLDLVHTLTYKGLSIISGKYEVTIQIWIISRFFEAFFLLASSFQIHKLWLSRWMLLFSSGGVAVVLLIAAFHGFLPSAYVDGEGLTHFKIWSEYLIIMLLFYAAFMLYRKRHQLDPRVVRFTILALFFTALAEASFTIYLDLYDINNLVGHIFKLFSFWFLFIAIIQTTLVEPYQNLKLSQAMLSKSQSIAKMGCWYWDWQEGKLFCSREFFSVLGISSQESVLSVEDFIDFIPEVDQMSVYQTILASQINTEKTLSIEHRIIRADGQERIVCQKGVSVWDAKQKKNMLLVTMQDITEKKQGEQRILRHLEFERVVALVSRSLLTVDKVDFVGLLAVLGKAFHAHRAHIFRFYDKKKCVKHLYEWCAPGVVAQTGFAQDVPQDTFPWLLDSLHDLSKKGGVIIPSLSALPPEAEKEKKQWAKEGVVALIRVPVHSANGGVTGFMGVDALEERPNWFEEAVHALQVVADMVGTHWQKEALQAERLLMQDQAMRTAHLSSLGVLSASIAHEINNPNNLILFNASMISSVWHDAYPILQERAQEMGDYLLGGVPVSEVEYVVPELIDGITESSRSIVRIIDDLKRTVRQNDSLQWRDVDIAKVIDAAIALIRPKISKHTRRFYKKFLVSKATVYGNAPQLEQVIVNLLSNALEALPDKDCAIEIQLACRHHEVVVIIKDEGRGIAESVRHRIFEPLFTTKQKDGGTGLGLAISKKILDRHKGRLEISSEVNWNTVITMILPERKKKIMPKEDDVIIS
ncbi:MASE3 domain-containing protein [Magnetococcales bacterium HHB-1]